MLFVGGDGWDDVVYLFEDRPFENLHFETIHDFGRLLLPELLVLEQFVGDDETLIIPFFDGLLDFLVIGLDGEIHGFDLVVDSLVYFELVVLLDGQVDGHVGVDGDMRAQPGVGCDLVYPYSLIGVYLQHPCNQVGRQRVDIVRNRVYPFWVTHNLRSILRYSSVTVSSSKGSEPASSAYRITPQLHTSTEVPSYLRSPTISGAA